MTEPISHEELHADNVRIHARLDSFWGILLGSALGIIAVAVGAAWVISNALADLKTTFTSEINSAVQGSKDYTDMKVAKVAAPVSDLVQVVGDHYNELGKVNVQVEENDEDIRTAFQEINNAESSSKDRMRDHIEREHR